MNEQNNANERNNNQTNNNSGAIDDQQGIRREQTYHDQNESTP